MGVDRYQTSGESVMDPVIPVGTDWRADFERWLVPFLAVLKHGPSSTGVACRVVLVNEQLGTGIRVTSFPGYQAR